MRTFTTIIGLFTLNLAFAQIEITSSDLPMADDTVRYSIAAVLDVEELELGMTGVDLAWDYSWLESTTQTVDTFFTVGSSPFLYQFFFNNNFLYPSSYSTHCTRTQDLSAGDFSLEDPYAYYNNNDDTYHQTGFGVTVSSIPFSVPYDGNDIWFHFPMNYLDEDSCDFTSELSIPTLGAWIQTGHRENMVDGWGTLTTPYGTYDVLRHKSLLEASDSTYIDLLGFGTNIPRFDQYTYRWIAAGETAPVMEVITSDLFGSETVVSVRYQDEISDVPDNIQEQRAKTHASLYPIPAEDQLFIKDLGGGTALVRIVDAQGKEVFTGALHSGQSVDVSNWERGVYISSIQVGLQVQIQRIVLQ